MATVSNERAHSKLVSLLTEYDTKQSTRRGYNRYALGIYIGAAQEARACVEQGMTWEKALSRAFILKGRYGELEPEAGNFCLPPVNQFLRWLCAERAK